jgi:hypothetical protein
MAQNLPRNTCPLCEHLTHVPLLQFLPVIHDKEKGFRCSSCNERIRVARSTQVIGWAGGLALGATVLAVCVLAPSLASVVLHPPQASLRAALLLPLGIIAVSAGCPIVGALFARLALRLELWVDETP